MFARGVRIVDEPVMMWVGKLGFIMQAWRKIGSWKEEVNLVRLCLKRWIGYTIRVEREGRGLAVENEDEDNQEDTLRFRR